MQQIVLTTARGARYSARAVNSISYKLTVLFSCISSFVVVGFLWALFFSFRTVWIWFIYGFLVFLSITMTVTRFPRYYDVYSDHLEIICWVRRYCIPLAAIRSAEHVSSATCLYGRQFVSTWSCNEAVRLNLNYTWNCRTVILITPENPREFCEQFQTLATSVQMTTIQVQPMTFSPQPGMVYPQQPGMQYELPQNYPTVIYGQPQPGVVYGQQPQPIVYGQQPQPVIYGQQTQSGIVYGQQPQPQLVVQPQPQVVVSNPSV